MVVGAQPVPDRLPEHSSDCYGCAAGNARGLGASQARRGDRVILWFRSTPGHRGGDGLLHGGVTAALFDEALGTVPVEVLGIKAVTGTLTIVYRAPAPIGDELEIEAWADRVEGRKLHLRAVARIGDRTIAEAEAIFIAVPAPKAGL